MLKRTRKWKTRRQVSTECVASDGEGLVSIEWGSEKEIVWTGLEVECTNVDNLILDVLELADFLKRKITSYTLGGLWVQSISCGNMVPGPLWMFYILAKESWNFTLFMYCNIKSHYYKLM